MNRTSVRMATPSDITMLAILFDGYRQFYKQAPNIERARDFITERLTRNDSWLLVAQQQDELLGFCQLYPSFSSTQAKRIAILNDLYVSPQARVKGIGRALMLAAEELGRNHGLDSLELSTAISNSNAQALYESLGWQRDTEFYYYAKPL